MQFLLKVLNNSIPWTSLACVDKTEVLLIRSGLYNCINSTIAALKWSSILRFTSLIELTAYDTPLVSTNKYTLVYILGSLEYNSRIMLKVDYPQSELPPSLSCTYLNASWSEREVCEMFGIFFNGNFDLRRLLTDYGFEGFPLRKDFPLSGYFEVRYDDEKQSISYESVALPQDFRVYDISSPWEEFTKNEKP